MTRQNLLASTTASRDPLKSDFRNFLFAVWKHLGLPTPSPIQYDIARFLQHGPPRTVIEAFRGVGKSWITAAYVLWLLYCDPQHKILVVSASGSRADDFTTFVLQLIRDMPILAHLVPRKDQRESKVSFDVGPAKPDQTPSVKSVGITGQLTGGRANTIIADDIEVPNNSDTQGKRDKLSELVKEFDAVLKPNGRIVYLGTPQSEQSIYNLLPGRGYVIRVWPARYPTDALRTRYGGTLAPLVSTHLENGTGAVGDPTEPQRFTDEDLRSRELSYGRSGFALQFMLDTSLSDGNRYPLKHSDLIIWPLDPARAPIDFMWAADPAKIDSSLQWTGLQGDRYYRAGWVAQETAPYEGSVMFVDPSGRGKDETAYAVVKQLHGRLFLTAAGGFTGGYDDTTLKSLLKIAKAQSVNKILVEPNFGGGMFSQLMKSVATAEGYPVSIEDAEWSKTQKEARIIDTLEPVMNQHRLVVCPSVVSSDYESVQRYDGEDSVKYSLFWQLARLTKERGSLAQDDRLDALAGAVAFWERSVARNTEQAAEDHRAQAFNDELKKFVEAALGRETANSGRRPASSAMRRK